MGRGRLGKQHRGCGNTGMLNFLFSTIGVCGGGGGGGGGWGSNPLGSRVVSLSKQITFEMLTGM